MPLDAGIYGLAQTNQPAFNPLAELAQIQQLTQLQQQNKLGALAFQDRERALADAASQRTAVQGFGADTTANYNALLRTGNLKAAQDYQKGALDVGKTQGEIGKLSAETDDKTFGTLQQMFGTVQDPRQAAALLQSAYADPRTAAVMKRFGTLEEGMQILQGVAQDPQKFAQWRAQVALGVDGLAKSAKVNNVNLGGTMQTQVVQPATGQVQTLGSAPITQSADNVASNATSVANNIRSTSATRDVAQATRDAANITSGFKNEADLRKEFEGLPEVKNYKQAYPAFAAVKDAATRNTPQADINLVYGIAKLYDPTSVVREGEYATVANSPNIPERIKGYAQYLAGGGKLSPETKRQIIAEAEGRVGTYRTEADKARTSYEAIAKQRGMDPKVLFQAMGDAPAGAAQPTQAKPTGDPVADALKKYR